MKKVLFICNQNRLRSPTAEAVFSDQKDLDVRSAGLNEGAIHRLTPEDVEWAEIIFVMEEAHKTRLLNEFQSSVSGRKIIVLNIPDIYDYMDEKLVAILKARVPRFLN